MTVNEITESIIGSSIEVHRELGPGLLESAYRQCLCHELTLRGMLFVCERPLPVVYKGLRLDCGYRVDLPHWRVQLRMTCLDRDARTRACLESG